MGCPSSVDIGKTLVFSVRTHDPETGGLTDADSPPTYRIYEDETATPLLTGAMAVLDDANTTGFYTETITCTALAGFEIDKTYTVSIDATVGGVTGGITYAFRIAGPVTVADAVFVRDMDQVETTAPKHSLTTAVLKSVSKVDDDGAGHLITYRTDGVTEHARQTVVTDAALEPIDQISGAT